MNDGLLKLLLSKISWIINGLSIYLWDIKLQIVIIDITLLNFIIVKIFTATICTSYFLKGYNIIVVNARLKMV